MRDQTVDTLKFVLLLVASIGCAIPKNFDIDNTTIKTIPANPIGTYSSYGGEVEYNDHDHFYHYTVYVGGISSCDNGAVQYARPKLDDFMTSNQFSSYKVVKGEYSILLFSRCELFVQFER